MTDGEPETAGFVCFFFSFYFIKSQTSDSFVSHFYDHFAYLKTLDFSFNMKTVLTGHVVTLLKLDAGCDRIQ